MLQKEFCLNPIEVVCNGVVEEQNEKKELISNSNNIINIAEKAEKEIGEYVRQYYRRNGLSGAYYKYTTIDIGELSSCDQSHENICDPLHWYEVGIPEYYYAQKLG